MTTISDKRLNILNSTNLTKVCSNFDLEEKNVNNTERVDLNNDLKTENENGFNEKRAMTPKKKS